MLRLAKTMFTLAILAAFGGLTACDQNTTASEPTPRRQDSTAALADSNTTLDRAFPLTRDTVWIPVRPLSPLGWPWGSAWYSLEVDSGHTYQFTMRSRIEFEATMELFDGDSSLLRRATRIEGATDTRVIQIQYETVQSRRLFLIVQGDVGANFELSFEVLPGQSPRPDVFELLDTSLEHQGGPLLASDSTWINRTLHRTEAGVMESADLFRIEVDSGKLYTIHLHSQGNAPAIGFLEQGMVPIDTLWTRSSSWSTQRSSLTFAAYRKGLVRFAAKPSGPDFKPVHYRVAATESMGIPAGVYPDAHEFDDTPETASLIFADGKTQSRTLHRDRGVSDTDEILLIHPTDSAMMLEIHDSLGTIAVEAFDFEGGPVVLTELPEGAVRCFLVPASSGTAPIRVRITNRLPSPATYRIELRSP